MSVEKLDLQEFIGFCAAESEKRKWFEGAGTFAKTFLALKNEQEKAERARDKAYADRDAALQEIATKQAKYEGEMKAALADVDRVMREKAEAARVMKAQTESELTTLKAQTVQAREAKELAEGQLVAFRDDADREAVAIAAELKTHRAALADSRERLAAALKG